MEPLYKPEGVEVRWQRTWEDEGLYRAGAGKRRDETFVDLRAAAERDGRAAHGPRAERLDPGRPDPLAPDAGLRHALAARLRPRRHLDSERRREAAREGGHARARSSGARRSSSASGDWLRGDGGTIMGQFRSLGASLDYAASGSRWTTPTSSAVMRFFVHLWDRGLDLPRQPDHQLVPVPRDGASPTSRWPTRTWTTR